ncbi:MAG: CYTH domain-containing protein [Actinomycetota bacterium]|nr:CYTH domain-containing protein [Actinomycetota bacterium]
MNFEVEIKLSAPFEFALPDLGRQWNSLRITSKSARRTITTYLDTDGYDLFSCGAALRFRGEDIDRSGCIGVWTLKFAPPRDVSYRSARFEFEVKADGGTVPSYFDPAMRVFGAGGELRELAVLSAVRRPMLFESSEAEPVVELDDDLVEVIEGPNKGSRFREIEIELLSPSFEDDAEKISQLFLASGASHSKSSSKLEQAIENPGNHRFISGLLDRYDHPVVSDLSVLASMVLGGSGGSEAGLKAFAEAVLVGLTEDSARAIAAEFVEGLASEGSSGGDLETWISGLLTESAVMLAAELRAAGHVVFARHEAPTPPAKRLSELLVSKVSRLRRAKEHSLHEFGLFLEELVSLPWERLSQEEQEVAGFVGKWS